MRYNRRILYIIFDCELITGNTTIIFTQNQLANLLRIGFAFDMFVPLIYHYTVGNVVNLYQDKSPFWQITVLFVQKCFSFSYFMADTCLLQSNYRFIRAEEQTT